MKGRVVEVGWPVGRGTTCALVVLASLAGGPASAQTDPGPPMVPLAPRAPAPRVPQCDPAWREVARPPPDASELASGWVVTGARIVRLGWGYAAVRAPDGSWAVADPSRVPAIAVDARRRIVFTHALAHGGDLYVVGTRLTVLRFDGRAWHLEHQDLRLGERRTHAARLETCGGRLRAAAHGVAIARRDDGTWASLPREAARECEPPPLDPPRPQERCGNWTPGERVVRCAAGLRLWSVRSSRWLSLPDELRAPSWATVVEHAGGIDLIDEDQGLFHTDDGARWSRQPLAPPVQGLTLDGERIYASTDEALYARDVCAPSPASP